MGNMGELLRERVCGHVQPVAHLRAGLLVLMAVCSAGVQVALKRVGDVFASLENAKRVLREVCIMRRLEVRWPPTGCAASQRTHAPCTSRHARFPSIDR